MYIVMAIVALGVGSSVLESTHSYLWAIGTAVFGAAVVMSIFFALDSAKAAITERSSSSSPYHIRQTRQQKEFTEKDQEIAARLGRVRGPWVAKGSRITAKSKDGAVISVICEERYVSGCAADGDPSYTDYIYHVEVDGQRVHTVYNKSPVRDFYREVSSEGAREAQRKISEMQEAQKRSAERAARAKEEQRRQRDHINRIR